MIERILIYGVGGQGVQAMAKMISEAATVEGLEVVYTTSYGGQKRGGASNANVIISDRHIGAPMMLPGEMSAAVIMENAGVDLYESFLAPGGLMLLNSSMVSRMPHRDDIEAVACDAVGIAREVGNERTVNMVMLGALLAKQTLISMETVLKQLRTVFTGRKEKLVAVNEQAILAGYNAMRCK